MFCKLSLCQLRRLILLASPSVNTCQHPCLEHTLRWEVWLVFFSLHSTEAFFWFARLHCAEDPCRISFLHLQFPTEYPRTSTSQEKEARDRKKKRVRKKKRHESGQRKGTSWEKKRHESGKRKAHVRKKGPSQEKQKAASQEKQKARVRKKSASQERDHESSKIDSTSQKKATRQEKDRFRHFSKPRPFSTLREVEGHNS